MININNTIVVFLPPCITGYNYFSYFIKYNDNKKTFNISDFFIPIDLSDKYHFSLIFTIGIFNINDNTFITSGEGDYYSSIIKYNTNELLESCRHDVLSDDFNMDNVNFYFQFKYKDGTIENILIDETLDINKLHIKCITDNFEIEKFMEVTKIICISIKKEKNL